MQQKAAEQAKAQAQAQAQAQLQQKASEPVIAQASERSERPVTQTQSAGRAQEIQNGQQEQAQHANSHSKQRAQTQAASQPQSSKPVQRASAGQTLAQQPSQQPHSQPQQPQQPRASQAQQQQRALAEYFRNFVAQMGYHPELVNDQRALCQKAIEESQEGNPRACMVYALCLHLFKERGASPERVRELDRQALHWLVRAANGGFEPTIPYNSAPNEPLPSVTITAGDRMTVSVVAGANAMLGEWYRRGIGCGADFNRAFKYYKRATELGDATAHQHLADMYEKGAGIHRDEGMAFLYYRKAAEKGNVKGMYKTARAYELGRGTPQDFMTAKQWYRKAVLRGHFASAVRLAAMSLDASYETYDNLYEAVRVLESPRTCHDIAAAHTSTKHGARMDARQMKKWLFKAANRGHARSQYLMGKMYHDHRLLEATGSATVPDGKGGRTPINTLERAFFWYHQAALQGFQPAQFAISGMYRTGAGVPVDPVMADKWAQAASRPVPVQTRGSLKDFANVPSYSLVDLMGPPWTGNNSPKPCMKIWKDTGVGAEAGLDGMPGISGSPPTIDVGAHACKDPHSCIHNKIAAAARETEGMDPYEQDTHGFGTMVELVSSMHLAERQTLQDRNVSGRIPSIELIEAYKSTFPRMVETLTCVREIFRLAEAYTKNEKHHEAIEEYLHGFSFFEGMFDLDNFQARLLAAISVQVVTAQETMHCHAQLVDCFLNLLNQPPELGIVHLGSAISVMQGTDKYYPTAVCLLGCYRIRVGRYALACHDFEAALKVEEARLAPPTTTAADGKPPQGRYVSPVMKECAYWLGIAKTKLEGRENLVDGIRWLLRYLHWCGTESVGRHVVDAHLTIAGACLALNLPPKLIEHYNKAVTCLAKRPPFYGEIINSHLLVMLKDEVMFCELGGENVRQLRWSTLRKMVEGKTKMPLGKVCDACGMREGMAMSGSGEGVKLKGCKGCGRVWYCGVNCQIAHWVTRHSKECVSTSKRIQKGGAGKADTKQ
ncbi:hypothetical protein HDU85_000629 [Gaertneriomyces sp. JEL0708]|nr:hypothetical protein HDU85_000629 [Gaertneriomyces sp. JEL0708]